MLRERCRTWMLCRGAGTSAAIFGHGVRQRSQARVRDADGQEEHLRWSTGLQGCESRRTSPRDIDASWRRGLAAWRVEQAIVTPSAHQPDVAQQHRLDLAAQTGRPSQVELRADAGYSGSRDEIVSLPEQSRGARSAAEPCMIPRTCSARLAVASLARYGRSGLSDKPGATQTSAERR